MFQNRLSVLTEIAILAALGVVLDKIVLFQMPQGGSVTLVMLPIFLLAFRRGLVPALIGGFVVGTIQLFFGGYFLNFFQVSLDYLLAYSALGLAGLFVKEKQVPSLVSILSGATIASLGRLFFSFLSGVIFYGEYAPKGVPVWQYSLVYNASYIVPCAALALVVLVILVKARPEFFKA